MKLIFSSALFAVVLLNACTTYDPVRVEDDFGKSVRSMVSNQIYDANAPGQHAGQPPGGLDGTQAEAVLKKQRESVGNPTDVESPIEVRVNR